MFDKFGQPNGYGQGGPFHDPAAPAKPQPPQQAPLQQAVGGFGPSQYPVDPGFQVWRQSSGQAQPIGAQQYGPGERNPITGGVLGPNEGGSVSAPMSFGANSSQSHPVQQGSPFGAPKPPAQGGLGQPAAPQPNLSDPNTWMGLVGNDAQLTDFVTKGLGHNASIPGRVDYYKKVVQGQPGANATEQAGSADYYNKMFAADPVSGVKAGGGQRSPLFSAIMPQSDQSDQQHQHLYQMLQNLQM